MPSGYKDPEYMKKYQAANREEINAKARARYAANREREVARASAWNKANRDKCKAAAQKRHEKDPEKRRAQQRAAHQRNPERKRQANRAWNEANPGANAANAKRWRAENPEKSLDGVKKWAQENPDKVRDIARRKQARRRARLRNGHSPGVTAAEWAAICEQFSDGETTWCAYCEKPATSIDHVLSIKNGGLDEPDNVVPCCGSCNSSKGAKLWPYEWLGRGVTPVNAFLEKWGPRGR